MLLQFFSPFKLWFEDSFSGGPLILETLESSDLNFMEVILFLENLELFGHFDHEFVM